MNDFRKKHADEVAQVSDKVLQDAANGRGIVIGGATCEACRIVAVCTMELPSTIVDLIADAHEGDHSGIGELGSHVAAILIEGLLKDLTTGR